jgi:hypothetical protein
MRHLLAQGSPNGSPWPDPSPAEFLVPIPPRADVHGGTRLTVIESGFDRIPLPRRAEVFRGNEQGWAEQMKNIEAHVAP